MYKIIPIVNVKVMESIKTLVNIFLHKT